MALSEAIAQRFLMMKVLLLLAGGAQAWKQRWMQDKLPR